jgi:hypothetical protein
MLNYVNLFLFNFKLHPKLGVNDPNSIHNLLCKKLTFKFFNEAICD